MSWRVGNVRVGHVGRRGAGVGLGSADRRNAVTSDRENVQSLHVDAAHVRHLPPTTFDIKREMKRLKWLKCACEFVTNTESDVDAPSRYILQALQEEAPLSGGQGGSGQAEEEEEDNGTTLPLDIGMC
jgi:hypothetical protein